MAPATMSMYVLTAQLKPSKDKHAAFRLILRTGGYFYDSDRQVQVQVQSTITTAAYGTFTAFQLLIKTVQTGDTGTTYCTVKGLPQKYSTVLLLRTVYSKVRYSTVVPGTVQCSVLYSYRTVVTNLYSTFYCSGSSVL